MSLYSDRCLGVLLGLALASPCRRLLGKDPGQGVSCLHPGLAPSMLVHLPCPREADPGHPLVRGSHLFPQHLEAGWQRSAGRRAPQDALQHIQAHASRAPGRAVWDGTPSPSDSGRGTQVWFILSAWRHCPFPLPTGKQKSAHPPSEGGVAGSPSARPEGSPERKPRMEPWWGLFYLTFLCSLMHVRGKGGFALGRAAWVCISIWLLKKKKKTSAPNHFHSGNGSKVPDSRKTKKQTKYDGFEGRRRGRVPIRGLGIGSRSVGCGLST